MSDNEKKKEYLNGYKNMCNKIKSLEEQIHSLREIEQSAKISHLSDMPKGGSNKRDLSDYIVELEELIKKITCLRQEKEKRRLEIEKCIANMEDGLECDILRKRYIEFKHWEQICVEIGYSWRQTHRLHSNALYSFDIK